MSENPPEELPEETTEESAEEGLDADVLEQELLDAMKTLRRQNKKVEEYLDGINPPAEKPQQEGSDDSAS